MESRSVRRNLIHLVIAVESDSAAVVGPTHAIKKRLSALQWPRGQRVGSGSVASHDIDVPGQRRVGYRPAIRRPCHAHDISLREAAERTSQSLDAPQAAARVTKRRFGD